MLASYPSLRNLVFARLDYAGIDASLSEIVRELLLPSVWYPHDVETTSSGIRRVKYQYTHRGNEETTLRFEVTKPHNGRRPWSIPIDPLLELTVEETKATFTRFRFRLNREGVPIVEAFSLAKDMVFPVFGFPHPSPWEGTLRLACRHYRLPSLTDPNVRDGDMWRTLMLLGLSINWAYPNLGLCLVDWERLEERYLQAHGRLR